VTSIRAARSDDAADLARVFVAAWQQGYRGVVADDIIDGLDVAERTEWLAGRLTDAALETAVAEDGGDRVIGFVRYGPDVERPDQADIGYVAALYVDPDASGAGVGRALLEHAVDEMRASGRQTISLWVFRDNERARRLYERAGFTPAGIEIVDPEWRAPQVRYVMPAPAEAANRGGQ
jgi:ribosomal protein S18 acetylase RimI-like enzyme